MTIPSSRFIRTVVLAFSSLFPVLVVALSYPETPEQPVTDTYHGVKITDAYRWMEGKDNSEFQSWLRTQEEFARGVLQRIPGRETLAARLSELEEEGMSIRTPAIRANRLFFLRRKPGESVYKLAMMDGSASKVLVDPKAFDEGKTHATIDWFKGSNDGKLMAMGISRGGSENSTLRVYDVKKGRFLKDAVSRAGFNEHLSVKWLADNRHFFYNRAGEGETHKKMRIYLHEVGTDAAQDTAIWGYEVHADIPVESWAVSVFLTHPGSEHVVAIVVPGVSNNRRYYTARLDDVLAGKPGWRKLADTDDRWFRGYLHNDALYVLAQESAPGRKLLKVDLKHPEKAPVLVIPPGEAVLEHAAEASDALYVRGHVAGVDKLVRVPYATDKPEWVDLPFAGRIRDLQADVLQEGAIFRMEGWLQPPHIYRISRNDLVDTGMLKGSAANFGDYRIRREEAESEDGTKIPVTVLHHKDMKLDGSHPTILMGYGAYGFAFKPKYDAKRLAWLERGGIFAIAHVRGGGEYGEAWHKDGKILTKSNTIMDFVASAQHLIDRGYTSPKKLAGMGRSAGGLTIGGAVTERPELFAVANHAVGLADLLRTELSPNGPANIPEFGSVKHKYQFLAMHSVSPYHRIQDGVHYPAVIVTTGINDFRVSPWQPGKFAARLQQASASGKPVLLRVDEDAGHGRGSTLDQKVRETADIWSFYLWQMGDPAFQPAMK